MTAFSGIQRPAFAVVPCKANRGGTSTDQELKQLGKSIVHDFALFVEGGCNGWHIAVKIFFFHGFIRY